MQCNAHVQYHTTLLEDIYYITYIMHTIAHHVCYVRYMVYMGYIDGYGVIYALQITPRHNGVSSF